MGFLKDREMRKQSAEKFTVLMKTSVVLLSVLVFSPGSVLAQPQGECHPAVFQSSSVSSANKGRTELFGRLYTLTDEDFGYINGHFPVFVDSKKPGIYHLNSYYHPQIALVLDFFFRSSKWGIIATTGLQEAVAFRNVLTKSYPDMEFSIIHKGTPFFHKNKLIQNLNGNRYILTVPETTDELVKTLSPPIYIDLDVNGEFASRVYHIIELIRYSSSEEKETDVFVLSPADVFLSSHEVTNISRFLDPGLSPGKKPVRYNLKTDFPIPAEWRNAMKRSNSERPLIDADKEPEPPESDTGEEEL